MFEKIEKNKEMLKGAYRKLKSYYYYNNNFLIMRKKIAEFESDRSKMDIIFDDLSSSLCHPIKSKEYIAKLIDKIDFFVVPKKFESETFNKKESIISNTISRDKKMKSVNFFIDAPIELHILDTLFTVFLGKISLDNDVLTYDVYGNTLNNSSLFNNGDIIFENRNLFNRYFNNYSKWRNNAFSTLEEQYKLKKDSVLISLDIKSYYYSVSFSFSELSSFLGEHEIFKKINRLTLIVEKMYDAYYKKIINYRKDIDEKPKKSYPLPIGLFSSMVLGNVYLADFDKNIKKTKDVLYYGRYVDDLLMIVDCTNKNKKYIEDILDNVFVSSNLLKKNGDNYAIEKYQQLKIQNNKIKLLFIDHNESRAILDIYNDTIKIIPSQMNPLPNDDLDISKFDESVYSIENFTKENKIRDIGFVGIDSFKVGKYFSMLPRKYAQLNYEDINKEINDTILQIKKFFTGSQCIEFYSNWLNYVYFLVVTEKNVEISKFYRDSKKIIDSVKHNFLDDKIFKKTRTINKKVKEYLNKHLNLCINIALCLNDFIVSKHFYRRKNVINCYKESNMFNHNLVTFPLANYLEYNNEVAFCKMDIDEIGIYPKEIENSFKFVWSPRFIHYHELLLLLFYFEHNKSKKLTTDEYSEKFFNKYKKINYMYFNPFDIYSEEKKYINDEYIIKKVLLPFKRNGEFPNVSVAIGSLNVSFESCIAACKCGRENIKREDRKVFFDILKETYNHLKNKKDTMFLVLPELCFPIYWINDLISFSKSTGIGVITGVQYIKDDKNRQYNYVATILPFLSGTKKYSNVYLTFRDKNDYSPIEFVELAKHGYYCENKAKAEYHIYSWNGIKLTPMICYEFTDIMARALLKGKCDFVAVPVFNPDTTYFSNIIDSSARDLHAFIVQSNTSFYGDSRVTGPFSRDKKDIFKIKGGDNDHVVIGTIDYKKYKLFQFNYDKKMKNKIEKIKTSKNNKKICSNNESEIKPFSARFKLN